MYCNWKSQDETTIYNRFWKKFIEDQYSVDSKVVSCDVLLEGKIDEESLRSFYYFGNSLWVLNAINNYNPTAKYTTNCEFIKVINKDNYLSGQYKYNVKPYFKVFNSSKELWDEHSDYIQLESPGDYKYIYVSSDGVQWEDRDNLLQDVYVNQDLGSGQIEAGEMVQVKIETKYDIQTNEEGNIVINKGMATETNVFVKVMLTSPITIFHQNGNIFDKTQGLYLLPGNTKTIYFTSSVDVELVYNNGQVFKNSVFTYVNNSKVDMYGTTVRVSKGAMIPIKFEYDAGSAFGQITTDNLVFKANGVQILALTVVANP